MKTVLFKDLNIGDEFYYWGSLCFKKSSKTGKLKNGKPRDWDYFSPNDEVNIENKTEDKQ